MWYLPENLRETERKKKYKEQSVCKDGKKRREFKVTDTA